MVSTGHGPCFKRVGGLHTAAKAVQKNSKADNKVVRVEFGARKVAEIGKLAA